MGSLPMPVRVAAGLLATAVEEARELPRVIAGLPVTAVSQVLQASMRLQQRVTALAIKGDEALSGLRGAPETPEWATFDEPVEQASNNGWQDALAGEEGVVLGPIGTDPVAEEAGPEALPGYDALTIAQLRGRLRTLSLGQLEELLAWETAHQNRPAYVTMLANRIATVTAQG